MLQDIIKSAMIGTSRYVPTALSPIMQEVGEKISPTSEDREDNFLKLTAAYLLLQEAGKVLPQNNFRLPTAPEETKAFISAEASALLKQFLQEKNEVLTDYFIFRCLAKNKVILPVLLPELLNRAMDKKQKREQVLTVCGTRGIWLASLNPAWQQLLAPAEEQVWETGTWDQRKSYFKLLRQTSPQQALALLQANLQEETANNRAELLDLLQQNLSLHDETFLATQLSDRSTKVKGSAHELLKSLPGSALYQALEAFVKGAVSIKEERVLLITKKKVLHINSDTTLPDELYAAGIEKVSSQKGIEDIDYWLSQAIAYLHPDFWQEHFGLSPKEAMQLFSGHKAHALWLSSLTQSAMRYHHRELAEALLASEKASNIQLLEALPLEERFKWAESFRPHMASHYLHLLLDEAYTLIPTQVCQYLLQQFVQQPYNLNQQDYLRWALQMPVQLLPVLQQYILQENEGYQARYFKNICADMSRIIETREQLNASI